MSKLGQELAFPLPIEAHLEYNVDGIVVDHENGMTKRFYAACAAMQGILAGEHKALTCVKSGNHSDYGGYTYTYNIELLARNSYRIADELLKQENDK